MTPQQPSLPQRCQIAIIGGGVAGLSTAWALARAGQRDVVLVEAESDCARHSSGLNAAILRTLIDEDPVAELAARSAPFFEAPPADFAAVPLLRPVGLVLTADVPEKAAALDLAAARTRRPVERLSPSELRRRAPFVRIDAETAWWMPTDGVLDIAALTDGYAHAARALGVAIHTGCPVAELIVEGSSIVGLRTRDGRELRADQVVLAAGGWAGRLGRAAGSGVELAPMRRHLLVTAPDPRVDPDWPVYWNVGDTFYARPESGGLMICACDESRVDPDRCDVQSEVLELVAATAARHLPDFADAAAAHLWCGMRTFAEDREFVIGPDPDLGGLFWVAGLGGHGMTTAPAVGELAAAALMGRANTGLLAAFAPGRAGARAAAQEPGATAG
ncbi:NAD(P)/FAD-dependent oxidoreductase [Engelhardtia mirabilis]|uniref:4-methylaminobutanoate oxidase (Formaldehyde-forming) n=1 Tax=Engelhardtia mirabilis TaxID=2528011 RepID=A0A518BL06_9BACT|nr:4-methylaminobutanoate oxidase (formaldehyde-forming) [Planctomycetes bacterium Pla133]QDV01959.1 4-methylaminobutanoate oxidase (formaldehyde-forming) [Planctomycetes bacterium Pla86]